MSLKMITPIVIDDSNMTNTIAEPDLNLDEVEWVDNSNPTRPFSISNQVYNTMVSYGDYFYCSGAGGRIYKVDISDGSYTLIYTYGSWIYCNVLCSNGYIYFFGSGDEAVKLNPTDDTYSLISGFTNNPRSVAESPTGYLYTVGLTGTIFKMDTSSDGVSEVTSLGYGVQVTCITATNTLFLYAGSYEGEILKINAETDVVTLVQDKVEVDAVTTENRYNVCLFYNQSYIYFLGDYKAVNRFTIETEEVEKMSVVSSPVDSVTADPQGDFLIFGGLNIVHSFDPDTDVLSTLSFPAQIEKNYYLASALFDDGSIYCVGSRQLVGLISPPYQIGDRVIKTSTHLLYEAATITKDDPEDGVLLTVPSWGVVSATNKYRAFDYTLSSKTQHNATIDVFEFTPEEPVTTISFFGLENITRVYVQVREDDENGSLIYNDSKLMAINAPLDDLIVNEELLNSKVIFDDLPVYSSPHISVTFNKVSGSTFLVGDIVLGNARTFGVSLYQSSTSRTSYNTVEYDTFGTPTIVQRPSAEYTSFEVAVFPQYSDYVERLLKDSLDKIRVWVAEKPDDEKLFTIGYYERSPITYSSPSKYDTTLKIRGLT